MGYSKVLIPEPHSFTHRGQTQSHWAGMQTFPLASAIPKYSLAKPKWKYANIIAYKITNKTHGWTQRNLWTQTSGPTYIIWKLTGRADNKQLSSEHEGGRKRKGKKKSKLETTNMSDVIKAKWQALCEKDWRVYSYLLSPGFQYQ